LLHRKRASYNGITPASQAGDEGSTPFARSNVLQLTKFRIKSPRNPVEGPFALNINASLRETQMATFRGSAARRAAFLGWAVIAATCLITGSALLPVSAATEQAVGSDDQTPRSGGTAKPGADAVPESGQSATGPKSGNSAVDPNVPVPPADARTDARELVKRRMELCRQRPEICAQEGKNRDEAGMRPPEGTSKD
jgi:hypothetical protein